MTVDSNVNTDRGREVVTYVRVGRGMVKVTKYENEQPKSPSDTNSMESSNSSSSRSTFTPEPSRGWLRRPRAKGSNKRAPGAHRSRSRSKARSLHAIRRTGGYMHSESDLTTPREGTPSRRGRPEPQETTSTHDNPNDYPKPTPRPPNDRGRRGLHITPPQSTPTGPTPSNPSPDTLSWATESEIDPVVDSEMWSSISRLEDELVTRFGRGVVPQLTALRQEKSSAPPTTPSKGRAAFPADLVATLQRNAPPARNDKLKQRSFDPITTATTDPPRRVYRAKSSPTLSFPLPPPTLPSWVITTPLPKPPVGHRLTPSSALMRAKAGPPPPFSPPPNFPPPPPPPKRREDRDMQKELDALVALYDVLEAGYRFDKAPNRSTVPSGSGQRRPVVEF